MDEKISRQTFLKIGAAAAGALLLPPELTLAAGGGGRFANRPYQRLGQNDIEGARGHL